MISTMLLVAAGLSTAATLLWVARGQAQAVRSADELLAALHPVDLDSFRNLTDPEEDAYLREHLSPSDFRRVQRARISAACAYVWRIAHNAALLLRLGEAARDNPEPDIARAAQELAEGALQLRINSLLALAVLYARYWAPGAGLQPARMFDTYLRVRESTLRFSRLEAPTLVCRIDAAL